MIVDPKTYFADQKRQFPTLFKEWEILEEQYEKIELERFIHNEHFNVEGRLIELYERCIIEFENRISSLILARLAILISTDYKDNEKKLLFLQKIKEKVSTNKEALALMIIAIANVYINMNDLNKAKQLGDQAEEILDKFEGISPVHSDLYRLHSTYYYLKEDYVRYYKETLKFLGVVDLDSLAEIEKEQYAYNLSIASLLGEDIYNFIELLSHPVFDALRNKPQFKWLVDLLYAFNSGNLKDMEALKPQWSQLPLLQQHTPVLERKIKLLCLMEVEFLVMKALSLNLVKGYIDEIEQRVFMKWVQPRVLDIQQVATMNALLDKWADEIKGSESAFYENAKEIIHY